MTHFMNGPGEEEPKKPASPPEREEGNPTDPGAPDKESEPEEFTPEEPFYVNIPDPSTGNGMF